MPAQTSPTFFSQHVPLLDPLAFDDALCFDARLEPALRADLRSGPVVKAVPVDRDVMIRHGLPPAMKGSIRGLRYGSNDTDECSFFWNDLKDHTTAMLYVLPGSSTLWVNTIYIPSTLPHLLHDGDTIQLYSPSQSLYTRFVYRQTPFLGCPHISLGFDVLETLGHGSSGVVRRCRDTYTGEHVAIKIIKANDGAKTEFHEGFPREYAVLQALWEPEAVSRYCSDAGIEIGGLEIVRCRALWFDKRRKEHYLVYPLARTDLDQIVTINGRLSERTAKLVAQQLCTALRHVHDSQIVHCDVKPNNILITGPGRTPAPHDDLRVVLADFGCALWNHEIPSMPRSMGTRGCKAPECKDFKRCDSAIDVFALGVSIFFALTGRFPYGYKEPEDIVIDARQLSVWPLLESVGVSTAGQDWLGRTLLLDPRARMTATEALEHPWIAGGELVEARPGDTLAGNDGVVYDEANLDDSESDYTSDEEQEGEVCSACGARRLRTTSNTGSETLEGSVQDLKGRDLENEWP